MMRTILEAIEADEQMPDVPAGMLAAIKFVKPNWTTFGGFRWAFPGEWTDDPGDRWNPKACTDGGVHVATTVAAAQSGGATMSHCVVVAYRPDEAGQWDHGNPKSGKLKVRRALSLAPVDLVGVVRREGKGTSLIAAHLVGVDLASAHLSGVDLRRACFTRANLGGARLDGADLRMVYFTGADLMGANLRGANLTGARFSRAYLSGVNLAGADLSRAYLSGVKLVGAYLAGADLAGANLAGADLEGADLTGANLAQVYCPGANFTDAKLSDCDAKMLRQWGAIQR